MRTLKLIKSYGETEWRCRAEDFIEMGTPSSVYLSVGDNIADGTYLGLRQARALHRWLGAWIREQERRKGRGGK